jgi:hypothetical protein
LKTVEEAETNIEVVTAIEAPPAEEDTTTDVTTGEAVTDERAEVRHDDEVGRHRGEGRQVLSGEGTTMMTDEGVMTDAADMIDVMTDAMIMTGGIEDRNKRKNGKNEKKYEMIAELKNADNCSKYRRMT